MKIELLKKFDPIPINISLNRYPVKILAILKTNRGKFKKSEPSCTFFITPGLLFVVLKKTKCQKKYSIRFISKI